MISPSAHGSFVCQSVLNICIKCPLKSRHVLYMTFITLSEMRGVFHRWLSGNYCLLFFFFFFSVHVVLFLQFMVISTTVNIGCDFSQFVFSSTSCISPPPPFPTCHHFVILQKLVVVLKVVISLSVLSASPPTPKETFFQPAISQTPCLLLGMQ